MPEQPIVPSRIIPPGAPLPRARAFGAPPGATDLPPWRTPPPAPPQTPPPPPDPGPGPGELVVHHKVELVWAEPEPEPRWNWAWLRDWARPWQSLAALTLAVLPIPPTGHSIGTAWAATLTDARTEASLGAAYILGLGAFTAAAAADYRTGRWYWRTALAVAVVGVVGMTHPFDIVTLFTGVHLP